MCTNSPFPNFFLPVGVICIQRYCYLYIVREGERGCIYASILHTENVFLKSVTLSTLFLFALWNGLRVHKLDCFQIKLNQKTCFWAVPNVLQPLMALVTSSIPLYPPAPNSMDIGSSVPTVSLHRSTPVAGVGVHSDTPARLMMIYASADLVSNMGSLLLPIRLEHIS